MGSAFQRVAARIRDRGPLSFAEYMRIVLYDPEVGFYATPRAGREGDFATSPSTTPEFGRLLGRGLEAMWEGLDRPAPFVVVEGGAARGHLARAIVASVSGGFASALEYHAVEQAAPEPSSDGIRWHRRLPDAPRAHVVLANELLDNLVAHRFVVRDGQPRERLVDVRAGRLAEIDGPPLTGSLARMFAEARARGAEFADGHLGELRTGVAEWVEEAARTVAAGYLLFLDYGGSTADSFADPRGSVKTYRGHAAGSDPYDDPGERDVTVPVDFDLVAHVARGAGFEEMLRGPQRDLLLALGAAERAAALARARSAADMEAWAGLREVLFGPPGTDITAQLFAKDAPPPRFVQSR